MFRIDNMSVKDYITDRVYIFFKPLLCCSDFGKKYEKSTCEICAVEVFTENIISILESEPILKPREKSLNMNMSILESIKVDIFPPHYVELIKNR